MIKSEFCQIPPNRLQPVDRIAPTWSIGLSTIGQSAVFDRAPPIPMTTCRWMKRTTIALGKAWKRRNQ